MVTARVKKIKLLVGDSSSSSSASSSSPCSMAEPAVLNKLDDELSCSSSAMKSYLIMIDGRTDGLVYKTAEKKTAP